MAHRKKFTNDELHSAIGFASRKLGIEEFKDQQKAAILSYLKGHDVFVNLPTGYGKSIVYQAAPFCWDYLEALASDMAFTGDAEIAEKHTAIVVSPLVSLMSDQVQTLNNRGIKARSLTQDIMKDKREMDRIYSGDFSLLFASPEVLLEIGGDMLRTPAYKASICGVFVDESHVIKHW